MLVELALCEVSELGDAIAQLHALQTALHAHMLAFIAEYDRRQAWREDGCTSMADWLVARLNVARRTAKDLIAIAGRLRGQPELSAALADGELSLDQARAASQLPDVDPVEVAAKTAAQLEAEVRANRHVDRKEDLERRRQRSLRWWWDEEAGLLNLRGRLPDVEGQRLITALERAANQAPPDPVSGLFEPFESRCADALCDLAGQQLSADPDVDRATVVIHMDANTGLGELESGLPLSKAVCEQCACDGRIQWVFHGDHVGVGRTTRQVPKWLERLVRQRDRNCQFPGCDRTRWLQVHHIVHWTNGGPTILENLCLLCSHHHRWLHQRDGRIPKVVPPRLRPDIRDRLLGQYGGLGCPSG